MWLTRKFILNPPLRYFQTTVTMAPLRQTQSIHTQIANMGDLTGTAALHGGYLARRYGRFQPYIARVPGQNIAVCEVPDIPLALLNKIKNAEHTAVNITSQKKDTSRLREILAFCNSLGIPAHNALPAGEDILVAWASS